MSDKAMWWLSGITVFLIGAIIACFPLEKVIPNHIILVAIILCILMFFTGIAWIIADAPEMP